MATSESPLRTATFLSVWWFVCSAGATHCGHGIGNMTSDRDNGPSDAVQVSKTCETAAQNERRAKNSFLAGRYQPRIRVVRCAPGHCCRGKGWWRVHDGSMCGLSVANTAKHAFVTPNDRSSPSLPYTAWRDGYRRINRRTRQSAAHNAKHAFVTPNDQSSARGSHFTLQTQSNGARHLTHS
jgi:hypothetical protein